MTEKSSDSDVGDEYVDRRGYEYDGMDRVFAADPTWTEMYDEMAEYNLRRDDEEGLSRKTRELIIVAYGLTQMEVEPVRNHVLEAYEHGATDAEILQTFQLANHLGGAWTIAKFGEVLDGLDRDISIEDGPS